MSETPLTSGKLGITQSIMSFKTPPDPSTLKVLTKRTTKRKIRVLDEDEYVQKVEKIIEKDFFPELDRLNAQSQYLEAAERKDVVTMNRWAVSLLCNDHGEKLLTVATLSFVLVTPQAEHHFLLWFTLPTYLKEG
jgi:hypothetical protein